MRHILTLAICLTLAACGGGSDLQEQTCNPDTYDCMRDYGGRYAHAFMNDTATLMLFTDDSTPRAGWEIIK